MTAKTGDKLDQALSELPRRIGPERDLWPGIAARISRRRLHTWPHSAWNAAAAAVVIAAAVVLAWTLSPTQAPAPTNPSVATTAVPGTQAQEPADPRTWFMAQLAGDASLPPKARGALLDNLRLVHEDILRTQAAVKKYPGDVNLRALLFNLYQQEARLLNDAQQAQIQTSTRIAT